MPDRPAPSSTPSPSQPRSPARVAGLLLAAGGGRRLGGRPKALIRYHDALLVERAARAMRDAGCDPVHVVVGAAADQVRARAELGGCLLVDNTAWREGLASSLRAGLRSLTDMPPAAAPGAALVALVDQPKVGAAAMARLRAAYRSPRTLASATYGGRRGHPVLLGSAHFAGVARTAHGDAGARDYLRDHQDEMTLVECGDVASPTDIDTPADLRAATP